MSCHWVLEWSIILLINNWKGEIFTDNLLFFSWKLCCSYLGILIWIEKQGWFHLSNADRRHNYAKSLGESLHYANKERAVSHVELGKPPALDVTPHHANPETLQLHYLGGRYGRQRCTTRSLFKDGLAAQPPAVSSSRGCLSCREQPFPRWCPSWGSLHWMTEWGGHLKWPGHFGPMWDTGGRRLSPELSARLAKLSQACITIWFPLLSLLLLPPSIHTCWSLINILHPKLGLNACFWRTPSVTIMETLWWYNKLSLRWWWFDHYVLVFCLQSDGQKNFPQI